MIRPTFPHTLADVTRALDGGLGLVVGDLPDGTIWVLQRLRKTGGYRLTHYDSPQRTTQLERRAYDDRQAAIDAMAVEIGLKPRG